MGEPEILAILDAGYDVPRIAFLLDDLPIEVLGRMRSDRVLYRPAPPSTSVTGGRPPRHGAEFAFGARATWDVPNVATATETDRYNTAEAAAWDRLHPKLTSRAVWQDHPDQLPIIEATVIRLKVDRLPSGSDPKQVWLWCSGTNPAPADIDRLWHPSACIHVWSVTAPERVVVGGVQDGGPARVLVVDVTSVNTPPGHQPQGPPGRRALIGRHRPLSKSGPCRFPAAGRSMWHASCVDC